MPEPKRPLKVFLCHARSDQVAVHALYTRLTKDGVDAWFDKEKLLPGQDWELEIRKSVHESDVVIVCLSKQFNQAGFRQKEVRLALETAMEQPEGEIFIIPARLEECDNLECLRRWHWVDLFENDGYEMLMRALRARADKIGATLQTYKSWLPNITNPHLGQQKLITPKNRIEEKRKPEKQPRKLKAESIFAILGAVAIIIFAAIIGILSQISKSATAPTATMNVATTVTTSFTQAPIATTVVLAATQTHQPTFTPKATITPTTTSTPAPQAYDPHPEADDYHDAAGIPMRLVPAGSFTMGSDNGNFDEKPAHQVTLPAFYMDKYEVTNISYKVCADQGMCKRPYEYGSSNNSIVNNYYAIPKYDNFPVNYVDWDMSKTYCEWRGAHLPTEAEWEKAARGTDGRIYPWGSGLSCGKGNYCERETMAVGSYESGKSPYGVYDMAGNVSEWVSDWYQAYPGNNPKESKEFGEQYRVLRGSSFSFGTYEWNGFYYAYHPRAIGNSRASDRNREKPYFNFSGIGFRCARDAEP